VVPVASSYAGAAALADARSPMTKAAAPVYSAGPSQATRTEAVPSTPSMAARQPDTTASATSSANANRAAGAPADPFEPPPPGISTAQMQARSAGAVTPAFAPRAQASAYNANMSSPAQSVERGQPVVTAARPTPRPDRRPLRSLRVRRSRLGRCNKPKQVARPASCAPRRPRTACRRPRRRTTTPSPASRTATTDAHAPGYPCHRSGPWILTSSASRPARETGRPTLARVGIGRLRPP
jgi:hypothetical protein